MQRETWSCKATPSITHLLLPTMALIKVYVHVKNGRSGLMLTAPCKQPGMVMVKNKFGHPIMGPIMRIYTYVPLNVDLITQLLLLDAEDTDATVEVQLKKAMIQKMGIKSYSDAHRVARFLVDVAELEVEEVQEIGSEDEDDDELWKEHEEDSSEV